MHLVLGKRSKRRLRKAEVPVCASDIETMPLTPPHVQPTLERKPTPNPRRSIAPPIISTPKTSAPAPFPPASGLDHVGARRHLPARRSGGSSPGVFHVVGGHRQRPRYPAGLLVHGSVPRHSGEYTRSLIFCLGSILLWVVFAYSIYRLLLACFDARESTDSRRITIAVTSALLVGLSAVVLYVLPDWAHGGLLLPEPFWSVGRIESYAYFFAAFLSALYPAYFAVRARYCRYADSRASAAIGETDS